MTPEEKHLLERTLKVAEENNEILTRMYRYQRMGRIFKFTYWFIVIALSFGAYYLIQPYVKNVSDAYSSIQTDVEKFGGIGDFIKNRFNGSQ
jgi:hypothetical protein